MSTSHGFRFHLAPPTGWCNDPNGVIHHAGRHHVFYQHVPDPRHTGRKHWAHASSVDGWRWQHHPLALTPDAEYENDGGCYSGSAVEADGRLALIYTGDYRRGGTHFEAQCVAFAADGSCERFEKSPLNPVLLPPEDVRPADFRDPRVFRLGGEWLMALGARSGERGQVRLYASDDLLRWRPRGVLFEGLGRVCECPDFFPLDGEWALLTSPIASPQTAWAVVGEFDTRSLTFTPRRRHVLDSGPDFYAPQTASAPGGRWMIGWAGNWRHPAPQAPHGFAWSMTLPRTLTLRGGRVAQTIDREGLAAVAGWGRPTPMPEGAFVETPDVFELRCDAPHGARPWRLEMAAPDDPGATWRLELDPDGLTVVTRSRPARDGARATETIAWPAGLPLAGRRLSVIVDRWTVEAFSDDGAFAWTCVSDLAPGPRRVRLDGAGGEFRAAP